MSFEDDFEDPTEVKKSIQPKGKVVTGPTVEDLKKAVIDHTNKQNGYKQRWHDLALKFRSTLNDKVLPENKTQLAKSVELEVVQNIMTLAEEMNTDENEKEGSGSVGGITLLFRFMLMQRDEINRLSYQVAQLDRKLAAVEKDGNPKP